MTVQIIKRVVSGRRFGWLAALLIAFASLTPQSAQALLKINITRGNVDPMPIALSPFFANAGLSQKMARQIPDVVGADLARSGLFRPIDHSAFIQTPQAMQVGPRFSDWRIINAQALLTGKVDIDGAGRMRVEFRLWDVFAGQQMTALVYTAPSGNWRRVAHLISDAIYKRLTGEEGYFDTRIVFVSETGPADKRIKRLAIMDQDGANHHFLTDGSNLVLTPRFSPTLQEITYLSYYRRRPRVYIYNIDTGQQELLGDFEGMTYAPRFSPDGNKVIMSKSTSGNSDIFTMDLRTRKTVRLTRHSAIDTSPSYEPNGKRVTFNSDRGGAQQLYVMNADGSSIKRISFGKGRYATPVWSPRGDLIAFTKFTGGRFYIGVMRPDGSGERLLSESYLDEGPTWSPNGRVLMYFRQDRRNKDGSGGRTRLMSVDLTGYNEREIITPTEASDPAWSPLASLPGRK